MGCPSSCEIGENLVFSITTHDPDTGIVTDADAVPTYRIYEDTDETAMVGMTGNMDAGSGAADQFDDANTTGFYIKKIECSAANGFEDGKNYTIYIEATVGGDKGAICYTFKAVAPRATAASVAAVPTADENAAGLLDLASAVDGKTVRETFRYLAARLAGELSGAGTGTEICVGMDGATTRLTFTVDTNGNITAVSYD